MCFKCGAVNHPGVSCSNVGNAELREYMANNDVVKFPNCGFGTEKIGPPPTIHPDTVSAAALATSVATINRVRKARATSSKTNMAPPSGALKATPNPAPAKDAVSVRRSC